MSAFFSGTWAGMGTIEDLDRGVVERFLATPVHRAAVIGARVLSSGSVAAIQAVIILLIGLALGATSGGVDGWVVIVLAAGLVAAAFSGISNGIALLTRQEATMIAIANFIGLPLLFFSSTLIARGLIPGWMKLLSGGNPVEWAVRAGRGEALATVGAAHVALYLVLLLAFTALTGSFATWAFRVYQRTL
jgi:ABC-2 type transport system permease protein